MAIVRSNTEDNHVFTDRKSPGVNTFTTDGADDVRMSLGNDVVSAGGGDDIIFGGWGNDVLSGDGGNDLIRGEGGTDYLFGGTGRDQLYGGLGNDVLIGGRGGDMLEGGLGADRFIFDNGDSLGGTWTDRIVDFNWREGDKIQLNDAGSRGFAGYTDRPPDGTVGYWHADGDTMITWKVFELSGPFGTFPQYDTVILDDLTLHMISSDFQFFG